MKILVIGGSYFLGRWFVQFAHKLHSVTVLNRGRFSVGLPEVRELVADRHDAERLKILGNLGENYDCIVDFCAYTPGDIAAMVDNFGNPGARYIYLGTVDEYAKGNGQTIYADSPLKDLYDYLGGADRSEAVGAGSEVEEAADMLAERIRELPQVEQYVAGKLALEQELERCCKAAGMEFTSVRPGIIYGPANYAPRESFYFDLIKRGEPVPVPVDATGHFQFAFVGDLAKLLVKLCELSTVERAYLCAGEAENYDSFMKALREAVEIDFPKINVTVEEVISRGIPLPWPLTAEESECYDSSGYRTLLEEQGIPLNSLKEGLGKAWRLS